MLKNGGWIILFAVVFLLVVALSSCGPTPVPGAPNSVPLSNVSSGNVISRVEFEEDNTVCYYIYTSGTIRLAMDCVYKFDDLVEALKDVNYGY